MKVSEFMSGYRGQHLLIDAQASRVDALLDLELGKSCLTAIAERIGMTIVLPATGVKFPHAAAERRPAKPGKGMIGQAAGYSAVVLLAESHISIHTFPESNFFTFDCYSCARFDESLVLAVLEETFELGEAQVQVIERAFLPTKNSKSTQIPRVALSNTSESIVARQGWRRWKRG